MCSTCSPTFVAPSSRRGLGLSAHEIARWNDVSRRMFVPFHGDGHHQPVRGIRNAREFDWEDYRARYGNIQRLELILEAENDSANRYKLSKQADVLMLFYVFSAEELAELFTRLGYPFEPRRSRAMSPTTTAARRTVPRYHAWFMRGCWRARIGRAR